MSSSGREEVGILPGSGFCVLLCGGHECCFCTRPVEPEPVAWETDELDGCNEPGGFPRPRPLPSPHSVRERDRDRDGGGINDEL